MSPRLLFWLTRLLRVFWLIFLALSGRFGAFCGLRWGQNATELKEILMLFIFDLN